MVNSTTLAPNECRMAIADRRSADRWASQAGSPMWTHCPSSRWSVTSQRPSPRATTWGRVRRDQEGPEPAPVVAARGGRPRRALGQLLELRVEVAAHRGLVHHRDAVLRPGLDGQSHAQRQGDGVADDQQPHRTRPVGTGPLQRGVLGRRQPGREAHGDPLPPGAVGPCPAGRAGGRTRRSDAEAGRRQATPNRPRATDPVTSPPSSPPTGPPSPDRRVTTGARHPRAAVTFQPLRIGRSGPNLE